MLGVERAAGYGRIWTRWVWFECLSGRVRGHSEMFVFSGTVEEMKVGRCRLEPKASTGPVCPVSHLSNRQFCSPRLVFLISSDKTEQTLTEDLIYFGGRPSEAAGHADQVKGQLLPPCCKLNTLMSLNHCPLRFAISRMQGCFVFLTH